MVQLDRVRRQFGPQVLFDGLSWLIPRGARLGLVGPNGAGKTTLMRILAGLEVVDAGELHKSASVAIGYLPQEVETIETGSVLSVVLDGSGELRRLEEQLETLERRLAALRSWDPDLEFATSAYGEVRHRFELLGGDRVEARAKAILTGLGVQESCFHDPLDRLSGGWRMRVVLARLLLGAPDLLLLDEPTNHLDLEAITWLESFLESFDGAFVVVSHDRFFLNRMVRGIVELDRGRLTQYMGDYDRYLVALADKQAGLEEAARLQSRELARIHRFVERFRYKATKARQVQSRLKALEKIERVEAPSSVKRIRFGFPPAPRSGDVVVRAEGVWKSFGDTSVYTGFDLLLRRGDRVALVGPNGAGKSTLLKLLTGRLAADDGALELGHNVILQYYAQHQLDALDPTSTVLAEIERVADSATRPRLRRLLGSFLFSGEDVEKKVAILSGGEKARLALAKMLLLPANLLLLDEPTNHLDLKSREVLEDALDEYQGTLVVISHDRYFINRIASMIAQVGGGLVTLYPGDYDTYLERTRQHASGTGAQPAAAFGEGERRGSKRGREEKRTEAEDRNRRYRERRVVEEKLGPVESEIAVLEARLREIAALHAHPEIYRDAAKARDLGREKAETESRLLKLYACWESLAAEMPD